MKKILIASVIGLSAVTLVAWQQGWFSWKKYNDPWQGIFETPFFLTGGTGEVQLMQDSVSQTFAFPLLNELLDATEQLRTWTTQWPSGSGQIDWVLAAYQSGKESPGLLLVMHAQEFSKLKPELHIPPLDSIPPSVEERRSGKDKIFHISYDQYKLVLARKDDLIFISESSFLVENAMKSLDEGSGVTEDPGFNAVREALSSEQKFFVHLPTLLSFLQTSGRFPELPGQTLQAPGGWMALQFRQATGMMLIDGYMEAGGQEKTLGAYLNGESGSSELLDIVPASVDFLWERIPGWGFRNVLQGDQAALDEYQAYWNDWVGNSWATAATIFRDTMVHFQPVFMVSARKQDALDRMTPVLIESELNYRGKDIKRVQPSAVLRAMAGMQDTTYCTEMGGYLLFTEHLPRIKEFIDAGWSRSSLNTRPALAKVDSVQLSAWNHRLFLDLRSWTSVYDDTLAAQAELSRNWNPLVVQLNPFNGLYLINAYLPVAGEEQDPAGSWAFELDAPVKCGPFALYNQLTATDCFVLQDSLDQLYLIDTKGELIWKKALEQTVVGNIRTVDFYDNKKYQLLFSTDHAIQLIDMKGNDVEGFPIRISAEVTSGLSAIDYEGDGDYRMFVGCANGNTYGFYRNGKPLTGWKPLKTGVVTTPVGHCLSGGKDYLYYLTASQELQVRNRKGDQRLGSVQVPADRLFGPVPDKTSEPGGLLVMKNGGDLMKISWNGQVTTIPFASEAHHAIAADINRDGSTDIIYMNGAGIFAVDQNGKVLFHTDPGDPLSCTMQLLPGGSGYRILVNVTTTGQSYLLDDQGNLLETDPFPLSGKAAWTGKPFPILVVADALLLQSYRVD